MAKSKVSGRELRLLLGVVLLLMALIGIGKIVTILLVLLGAYLIWDGVRKKS